MRLFDRDDRQCAESGIGRTAQRRQIRSGVRSARVGAPSIAMAASSSPRSVSMTPRTRRRRRPQAPRRRACRRVRPWRPGRAPWRCRCRAGSRRRPAPAPARHGGDDRREYVDRGGHRVEGCGRHGWRRSRLRRLRRPPGSRRRAQDSLDEDGQIGQRPEPADVCPGQARVELRVAQGGPFSGVEPGEVAIDRSGERASSLRREAVPGPAPADRW